MILTLVLPAPIQWCVTILPTITISDGTLIGISIQNCRESYNEAARTVVDLPVLLVKPIRKNNHWLRLTDSLFIVPFFNKKYTGKLLARM